MVDLGGGGQAAELLPGRRPRRSRRDDFVVEYDSVANNDHLFLRMRFEGDRVVVEARDVSAGVMPDEAATFTGRLVRP